MLGFLYSAALMLLHPTAVIALLLLVACVATRHPALGRRCIATALVVLFISGNPYVTTALVASLERRYQPLANGTHADAIVVLSGGTLPAIAPRQSVEVTEGGDRVLYAAELFRRGRAPLVMATGNVAIGGLAARPVADDMAELLQRVGVGPAAIVTERRAMNTREHGVFLCPMFAARGIRQVLLVTSAMHMRRSMATFQRSCPAVSYLAAPTDFRAVSEVQGPAYRKIADLIPTPHAMVNFADAVHEYIGLLYYRVRGWA